MLFSLNDEVLVIDDDASFNNRQNYINKIGKVVEIFDDGDPPVYIVKFSDGENFDYYEHELTDPYFAGISKNYTI